MGTPIRNKMKRFTLIILGIGCLFITGCGPAKDQNFVRAEIEQVLIVGKTSRSEAVVLLKMRKYEVLDEPNLPNLFHDRSCEYMPASYIEERFFGRYITVIDMCFDPQNKILLEYKVKDTTGGPMFFP